MTNASRLRNLLTNADAKRQQREKDNALLPVVLRLRLDTLTYDAITIAQANYETSQSFGAVRKEDRGEYPKFELFVEMLNDNVAFGTRKAVYTLDKDVLMPHTWQTINNLLEGAYNERTRLLIYTRAINYAHGKTHSFDLSGVTLNDIARATIITAVEKDAQSVRAVTANTYLEVAA